MRKYILIIMISLLCSWTFMYYFFYNEDTTKEVYQFQTGFYKSYNEALNYSKKFPSSVVIPEGDGYHVIVAMYENIDVINKMLMYYGEKDINITINKVKVDNNFANELSKYETLVDNMDNKDLYDNVNQNILNLYMETL